MNRRISRRVMRTKTDGILWLMTSTRFRIESTSKNSRLDTTRKPLLCRKCLMLRRPSVNSVNISVTSIASFLPLSTEQDNLTFTGTACPNARPTLSPIQEDTFCKQQAEKQREDAETRNVVWSGENSLELHDLDTVCNDDLDADCDDDPDYIRLPNGLYEKIDAMFPIGVRNKDGKIEAITYTAPDQSSEAQFGGFSENVPIRLQDIVCFSFHFFFFQFFTILLPKRLIGRFPKTRLVRKHNPFYSRPKILVFFLYILYTKTVFTPTSFLDITTILRRLLYVIANP